MPGDLKAKTGSALYWQSFQLGGIKLIHLIRLFVLARILEPDDFGLLAIAMTGLGVLVSLSDLGIMPALVQKSAISDDHYRSAWTIGIIRAIVIAAVLYFTAPVVANIFDEPRVLNIVRVMALIPLLESLASAKTAELVREMNFRSISIAKLIDALANTVISIAFAWKLGVWALVLGALVGPFFYTLVSYIIAPFKPGFYLNLKAAVSLLDFGKWIFITGVVTLSGSFLLRLIITRELGTEALGLYFMASRFAFLPVEIASKIIGSVLFPLYAKLQSDLQRVTEGFRTIFVGMLTLLLPIYLLMIFLSSSMVYYLIGEKWMEIVPLIQLLISVGIAGTLGDAMVPLFKGLGHPHKLALLEATQSILLIVFALIFINAFGLIGTAYAWLPAMAGTLFICVRYLNLNLKLNALAFIKPLAIITLVAFLGGSAAFLVDTYVPNLFGFILAGITGIFLTMCLLWYANRNFAPGLLKGIAGIFPGLADYLHGRKLDVIS